MSLRRPALGSIARWVLGIVLLAQVTLAAQACLMPAFRPASALAGASDMEGCDRQMAAAPTLCLAQCLQSDQISDPTGDPPAATPPFVRIARIPLSLAGPVRGETALDTGPPVYLKSHRLRL